jgi:tRNA (guanine-N7-)-methyltransferase
VNTEEPSFITRKRKKWKFGHFNQWPNCFQIAEISPAKWQDFFGNATSLVAEIGAGTADLTIGLAQRHPAGHFVAVDIKSDRLYTGAKFALQHQLKHIAFLRAPITRIAEAFAPASIKELWVTFPDPFPRKRQAKRRLTHPNFLQQYQKLLGGKAVLHFKTDNRELFLWSLEQLVQQGWSITELSFDLHESDLKDDYKITTAYERRFMAEGIAINYCTALPPVA